MKNEAAICKGIFGILESCWVPQQKRWMPQATPTGYVVKLLFLF